MAETKTATQRLYTIPLQAAWKVPYKQRAKKAVSIIQKFVERHMKTGLANVKVGAALNDAVWSRGIKYPPRKVKVQVMPHERDLKGKKITDVWVELEGAKLEFGKAAVEALKKKAEAKPEEKKAEAKSDEKKIETSAEVPKAAKAEVKAGEKKIGAPKSEAKQANALG